MSVFDLIQVLWPVKVRALHDGTEELGVDAVIVLLVYNVPEQVDCRVIA